MNIFRAWLFRILVLSAGGLLVYSWFQPWWSYWIYELWQDVVVIRPWGLEMNVPREYMTLVPGAEMAAWFTQLMWTYLGIIITMLLFSLFAKNKEFRIWRLRFRLPSFIIGLAGFSYIVIVVLAIIVAAIRTGEYFNTSLIGETFIQISEAEYSYASGSLLLGYWLACAAGPLLLVLALLHSKIMGKPKLNTQ